MIIKLADGKEIPVEMHKARMVQKIVLVPAEDRLKAMEEAGTTPSSSRQRTSSWTCSPTAASTP
jgi:hypothetical protein